MDDLLARLRTGEEAAWDEAFRMLYPVAFGAARHPMASLEPHEAEDVAIDSLTQLFGKVGELKRTEELRPLVATIAARKAISERRKKQAEKRGGGEVDSLEAMKDEEGGGFEPAAELVSSLKPIELAELSVLLKEALGDLEPSHATLLRQFIVAGKSYKELSEEHRVPMGSIGVILSRSLNKVREKLKAVPGLEKELKAFLR